MADAEAFSSPELAEGEVLGLPVHSFANTVAVGDNGQSMSAAGTPIDASLLKGHDEVQVMTSHGDEEEASSDVQTTDSKKASEPSILAANVTETKPASLEPHSPSAEEARDSSDSSPQPQVTEESSPSPEPQIMEEKASSAEPQVSGEKPASVEPQITSAVEASKSDTSPSQPDLVEEKPVTAETQTVEAKEANDKLQTEEKQQTTSVSVDVEGIKKSQGDTTNNVDEPTVETTTDSGKPEQVSLSRLFQYADGFDRMMMFFGSFFGVAHGIFLPVMMIIFGDTIELLSDSTRSMNGTVTATALMSTATTMVTTAATAATTVANTTTGPVVDPLAGLVEKMGTQAVQFCGLGVGALFTTWLQVLCWASVGERLTRRIRRKFLSSVLNQDLSWFDTHKSGELASRMSDDLLKVYGGVGDKNGLLCQWIATALTGVAIGFIKGWKLTLILLFGAGPFLAISGLFVTKLVVGVGSKEQDSYAKAGAVAGEVLSSVRTVVAFGGEKQEAERYDEALETARLHGVHKGLATGFGFATVYLLMFSAYGLGFYAGTTFVWDGEFSSADMVTTFFSVIFACFSLGNAGPSIQAIAEARGAAVAVYNIIDAVPSINPAEGKGKVPEKLEGSISFKKVHFKYPSRPDVQILNGLDLDIESGKTVALVGPSGCGKSTCLQLLQRFYDVDDGSVSLDGVDIRDLNVKWLRSSIGVVGQEPVLFHSTIGDNIAQGSLEEVTQDDIVAAAKKANAHDFISAFPDGYDTLVGERGAQMSGGQKQRIAIARALIRNPRILLLDEATSALDTESERVVQAALDAASEGRTTIIIAHRLTTVRDADCIVFVQDGQVMEMGSHAELMELGQNYYRAVNVQKATDGGDDATSPTKKAALVSRASSESRRSKKSATSEKNTEEPDEAEEEKDLPEIGAGRLFSYNKPEFPIMAIGAFCAMAYGVVFPLFGFIFAEILTVFQYLGIDREKYFEAAHFWSGMFPVLGVFCFLVLLGQFFFFGKSGAALTKRMRSVLFKAMLRQNIAYFDEKSHSTGALTTRLSADAALIQGATGQKMGLVFQLISTLVAALSISFSASWHMTLVILGVLPLIALAGAANTKALAGHGSTDTDEHLEAGKIAVEVIDNVRTVASLGLEERSVNRYMTILEPVYRKHKRSRHFSGFTTGMSEATFFFIYAITFAFGAFTIQERLATFNDVFTVFGAMIFAGFSLGQSAAFAPDIPKAAGAASRIFKLLDVTPTIDSYSTEGDELPSVEGNILLQDIEFHYPTRPDVQIMQGTTIQASSGQTVALVGQSGCGKSTSVSLLERFYDPLAGRVMLDGHNITSLKLSWLRKQMGIVQQEPILFDASIADNISYGDLDRMITIEEIHQAAKKANIHDFITELPDGYDTNVGNKGTQLSGGQKQRVAIARALIRNPKILLLDEATSALDTKSEKVVQEALDAAREGRTCIVIAHRLSTIHNADRIYVLGGGKVLEQGTHSELMALGGAYTKLNHAQEENNQADATAAL